MSGESWKEFTLQHKYAELPEEPKYVKKKKKQTVKRSKHKHQYADCIIDYGFTLKHPYYNAGRYCTICGRIGDISIGGPIMITGDKPVFKLNDCRDKYVNLEDINEN